MGWLIDAIIGGWCAETGVTPELLERWESGAEAVPADVVRQFAEPPFEIPASKWPRIGSEYRIRLHLVQPQSIHGGMDASTHPAAHARRSAAVTAKAHLRSGHPFLIWLGSKSLETWAEENKLSVATVRSYVRRGKARRSPPEAFRKLVARLTKGVVPANCWDL